MTSGPIPSPGRNKSFCLQPLSFFHLQELGGGHVNMTKVEPPCVFFEGEDLILFL